MNTEEQKSRNREKAARYRVVHPGRAREASHKWADADPERVRRANYRHKYGITLNEYEDILKRQGGVCAICGHINENGTVLFVDHNHETGKIRSLLCRNCNLALGYAKDDIGTLAKMIEYLTVTV